MKISKTPTTYSTLKFFTNLGNEFDLIGKLVDRHRLSQSVGPKSECGYFHSFENECKIDDLRMLWVEYSDPKTRKNNERIVDTLDQWRQILLLQTMMAQHSPYLDDDYDDYHHDYVARYSSYDSDDYGSVFYWADSD